MVASSPKLDLMTSSHLSKDNGIGKHTSAPAAGFIHKKNNNNSNQKTTTTTTAKVTQTADQRVLPNRNMENRQRAKRVGARDKVEKNAEVWRTIIRFFSSGILYYL